MKTLNSRNILSTAVSALMTMMVCSSVSQASDIEIYSNATGGKTSIMLMLDTSGSMGISSLVLPKNNAYGSPGDVDNTVCESTVVSEAGGNMAGNIYEYQYNAKDLRDTVKVNGTTVTNPTQRKTSFYKEVIINGTTVPYYVRGCGTATVDSNGKLVESGNNRFDRLSRLKDAVLTLLADTALSNNIQIGLGHFSSKTDLFVGKTDSTRKIPLVDGHSGTILLPANALTPTHRLALAQKIAAFKSLDTTTNEQGVEVSNQKYSSLLPPLLDYKASSGTPTAHAYAEAAAYMMGTQTRKQTYTGDVKFIYDGTSFVVNENAQSGQPKQAYYICAEVATSGSTNGLGYTGNVKWCQNAWPGINSTSGGKLIPSVQSNIKIPYGDSEWLNLTGNYSGDKKTAVDVAKTKLNAINFANDWDVYTKLPSGWRYGGWMKVDQQPMDIEPIAGLAWESFKVGNTQYFRNLVSYRASPFTLDGTNDNVAGGFSYSAATTKDPGNSTKYKAGGSTSSCDGNGIYFLTDGAPNSTKDSMARAIMNDTLTTTLAPNSPAGTYGFSAKPIGSGVLISPALKSGLFSGETGGWEYIGEYAKKLRNRTDSSNTQKNPVDMNIKTAVVGFGSSFSGLTKNADGTYNCASAPNDDAKNACLWGSKDYGDGGFYYAENSDDIKNSIINFVNNVTPPFDPIATGSPTLPQDALNPLRIQPYGYYASFTPKPQDPYRLWLGNMNKYHLYNGELYNSSKTLRLIKADGSLDSTANGLWTGGMLGQLPLGLATKASGDQYTKRTIYTNREISDTAPYPASASDELKKVNVTTLFGTGTSALFANDQYKNYWLNLLGYNVGATETGVTLANLSAKPELRQIGAVMHSTPILLTQSGKISYTSGTIDTTNRDDYLLFGSTQGLLHVVDADTGEEKFAFVPNEMMKNQKDAFLAENSTTGGKDKLFYGIDAPWVAYTQYVAKDDGTLTVNDSGRTAKENDDAAEIALKGLQWVYGGLRMGGRGYYALNLSDIDNPEIKFHIDPDAAAANTALSYMGQSWSKPTIGYVNFGGEKKLVMFVGGGYDAGGTQGNGLFDTDGQRTGYAGYEDADYEQSTQIGAGVYMFSATGDDAGELLWWSSANATAAKGAEAYTDTSADTINMKYSVVSQINAIDRDSDGLIDNLYFGDLGGQAFRVDLNNSASAKSNFATRVQRLYDGHIDNTGLSPRFYEMPSFSVHDGVDGVFGVLALSSGNRSSPLASAANSANDAVYVIYDNDIARTDLYASGTFTARTPAAGTLINVDLEEGIPQKNAAGAYNLGWKYHYSNTAGRYKGMNELYALDNMLYVNVFDRDGTGIGGTCGAGIKGDSYVYQFCLPTGKCPENFYASGQTAPNSVKIGAGILGAGLGTGYNNVSSNSSLVVNRNGTDCTIPANKNKPQCQLFDTSAKLKQLRWYESR